MPDLDFIQELIKDFIHYHQSTSGFLVNCQSTLSWLFIVFIHSGPIFVLHLIDGSITAGHPAAVKDLHYF